MIKFKQFFPETYEKKDLDYVFNKIVEERDSDISGYYNLPFETKALDDAASYIKRNASVLDNLSHIVIIGIGGSSLGIKALDNMLYHLPNRKDISLKFLEHTDPVKIKKSIKKIKLQSTLFIVISKSGTTIETTSLMKYALHTFSLLDQNLKQRLLIITDKNSKLHEWAENYEVEHVCINPNIGGRFCVLSSVGILPLLLLGYDVNAILRGARFIATSFFNRHEEHILQKALFMAKHPDTYRINILFSYSSSFSDFNLWYAQLWGESLGKINAEGKNVGLTPIGLIGSIDQHSFLQLILQGSKDKTVTFLGIHKDSYNEPSIPNIDFKELESTNFVNGISFAKLLSAQQVATMQTIKEASIPLDSIELDHLNEESAGSLIMYYELLTSAVGCIFDINTYNQPAVELGKAKLKTILN
ncbi:glucose-6-phosphate isomerase [Helicobacter sp. 13S00401-1]|uniref:glucose-6-phosphate isomerase n=1 Tax=Helicobacter sp. 13S00401-1 TaxID=1905758 RepID=UPI000BA6D74F|nr:glucose-6-phosphate isomerase [Helicobacter sp. 13S00401-1]PAF51328.1 glucose-6-phosphate isomerase [Helicobacter sp. 13S00401-1]